MHRDVSFLPFAAAFLSSSHPARVDGDGAHERIGADDDERERVQLCRVIRDNLIRLVIFLAK